MPPPGAAPPGAAPPGAAPPRAAPPGAAPAAGKGRLRLAFMGSPDFAVPALRALAAAHDIAAVYAQPPKPAFRGRHVHRCPVHAAADELGIAVRTPTRLRPPAEAEAFAALDLDAAIVAAYGLILPPAFLAAPRRFCLNIHASLLPRWRGAAPIQAAILAGDTETGITVMQMDAGLDTGAMLLREATPIGPRDTAATLHDRLAEIGARLVLRALAENPPPVPQPEQGVTYAAKLTRQDGRLDWTQDAIALDRRIRAFTPWPGTFTTLGATVLKILGAEPAPAATPTIAAPAAAPGTVLDGALTVACGGKRGDGGALRLLRVQAPGGAAMDAAAFLRGHPIPPGTVLGTGPGA
jgi:methionyl-tRNA formyltransferase